jgi:SAM-dependent methyltransferase
MKKNLKKFILSILSLVPIRFIPPDLFLWLSQRITSAIAYLLFIRDWQLEANGRPQFFKHRINLARWPFEPSRWAFVARGVYSRENMFRGCKVLDLCCGDGSYSYLFYSDIASHIDAVDNDSIAIKYARKYHSNSKIIFHQIDIVNHDLPSSEYDIVVWNAAICYFELHEIKQIILKIIKSGKPNMQLIGMIPKANGWVDHKTEFSDAEILRQLFLQYFKVVTIKEIDEISITTFYFQASSPY